MSYTMRGTDTESAPENISMTILWFFVRIQEYLLIVGSLKAILL